MHHIDLSVNRAQERPSLYQPKRQVLYMNIHNVRMCSWQTTSHLGDRGAETVHQGP